uniref:Uncharacterized protein LOC114328303 isoform X1 n=1 Tax=Diabrotica virgifera virgifera TaxID=50390 RepID=A0A6P7FAN4_DIAVI
MEWKSERHVLKLIEAYRRTSLLWDFQDPKYYKKPIKVKAWREIGQEVNMPWDECRRKIQSLLGSYRREKYRIRQGKRSGDAYVSRWYAYEALTFLDGRKMPTQRPKMEPKDMIIEDEDVDDIGVEVNLSELSPETSASSPINIPSKRANRDGIEDVDDIGLEVNLSELSPETLASSPINIPSKRANRDDYPTSSMLGSEFNIFDTVREKPNETDTFFTYVATKVNNYSSEIQTAVQHAVFEVLMKADKGFYKSTSSDNQQSNS